MVMEDLVANEGTSDQGSEGYQMKGWEKQV